jgi:outer membrane protein assembly factor BamB
MTNRLGWASLAALVVLEACGGSSGSSAPPPPVPPSVTLLSGAISRSAVIGTALSVGVRIQTNFSNAGTLYASATDATGVFQPGVVVTPGGSGVFTLELATSNLATEGTHPGSVTLNLCEDAACHTAAPVPSVAVPFSVRVMTAASAWPGNNLTTLSPSPGVPDWTMFQGNAAHTGYVPVTLNPDRFSTRWLRAATRPAGSGTFDYKILNSVTTSGGLFFDAEGTDFLASREHDGSVAWRYSVSSLTHPATNPPAVANNVVYMAAGNQESTYFLGLDAASGDVLFKSPMTSQWEHYLAPTIGTHGIYTDAGMYGGLYAFDTSGNQMFFNHEAQDAVWTPAVDSAGVYSYTGGQMRVADPVNGTVLHSIADPSFRDLGYEISGSPVLGAPGCVFVANYTNALYGPAWTTNVLLAFDVPQDRVRWQVTGNYVSTPGYRAGVLYAANITPVRLEARSESDGGLSWSWTPPLAGDTFFASEVLVTDNLVFVCTNSALYAIDLTTHKTAWSYPVVGRLALSARGVLYVAGQSTLTAFNLG